MPIQGPENLMMYVGERLAIMFLYGDECIIGQTTPLRVVGLIRSIPQRSVNAWSLRLNETAISTNLVIIREVEAAMRLDCPNAKDELDCLPHYLLRRPEPSSSLYGQVGALNVSCTVCIAIPTNSTIGRR